MQASFNKMLKSSLENTDSDEENNNICLISHETLCANPIKLSCSHKFLYKHIFTEIQQQKSGQNLLEIQKLKKFQFKCPYCRNLETGVLPWRSTFPQTFGINWPPSQYIKTNICKYTFKSGIKKGKICSTKCIDEYCKCHQRIINNRNNKKIQNKNLQCTALTKKGTRCSRIAKSPAGTYCLQHVKMNVQSSFPYAYFGDTPIVPTENVVITI
jgi:hypothetical protein